MLVSLQIRLHRPRARGAGGVAGQANRVRIVAHELVEELRDVVERELAPHPAPGAEADEAGGVGQGALLGAVEHVAGS